MAWLRRFWKRLGRMVYRFQDWYSAKLLVILYNKEESLTNWRRSKGFYFILPPILEELEPHEDRYEWHVR